jgi:hypothetical protein
MIKELENRIPQLEEKGLYAWDDIVTDKINEIIRSHNALELTATDSQQTQAEIAWINETFFLANKEKSAAHAMVIIKNRFDARITQLSAVR